MHSGKLVHMGGIHHVTGITRDVQANVDFYAGLLGLRLVKQTVNHNDPSVLHLFYGDLAASPGTLLTFFVWQDGMVGRRGHGQAVEVGFEVPRSSIGYWTARLIEHGASFRGPTTRNGETRIGLSDPDGLDIVLVGRDRPGPAAARPPAPAASWSGATVPASEAIRAITEVTLLSARPLETAAVLTDVLGYRKVSGDGALELFEHGLGLDSVRLHDARGFWTSAEGAGSLHHVAFRVADAQELEASRAAAQAHGAELSDVREHGYFRSVYFREPGGVMVELATDGPGMTIDEPVEELGTRLVLPPEQEADRADIEVVLPAFEGPSPKRRRKRDLGWVHRFVEGSEEQVLLLLHGSGASELQLLPLARRVGGGASLLAPRGRSLSAEGPRYFARRDDGSFDLTELIDEADQLAEFASEAAAWYGFDPRQVTIIGYSNGAHVGVASLARNPGAFAAAALLRTVAPVPLPPGADLRAKPVLMLQGEGDHLLRDGADEELRAYLRRAGAALSEVTVPGGHRLGEPDERALRAWLAGSAA